MADYIPSADSEFDARQDNFITYASANAAALGLDPLVDLPPLTAAQTTWTRDRAAYRAAQAAAQLARQAEDAARGGVEGVIHPLVASLQPSSEVDDAERQALGIRVRDTVQTAVGPPITRLVVSVDISQCLQHTISFAHKATPTRQAKPAGVRGAQAPSELPARKFDQTLSADTIRHARCHRVERFPSRSQSRLRMHGVEPQPGKRQPGGSRYTNPARCANLMHRTRSSDHSLHHSHRAR